MWNFKSRCDLEKQFAILNVEIGIYFKLEVVKGGCKKTKSLYFNRIYFYQ